MAASSLAGLRPGAGYRLLIGVGGIGTGVFFRLESDRPLGRNESRPARMLDARDYCKLHIISHYVAELMGAGSTGGGFRVIPVARVGSDEPGRRIVEELSRSGVDVSYVKPVEGFGTLYSVCFLYPDGAGGNITSSTSAATKLEPYDIDECEPLLARAGTSSIALAVPEVPLATRDHLLQLATVHGAWRVASFASSEIQAALDAHMISKVDLLALNDEEAGELAGSTLDPGDPDPFLARCATRLLSIQPRIRVVVSAGRHGAFGMEGGRWDYCPSPQVRVANTAGAGDALLAGVICGVASGMPFHEPACSRGPRPLATALDLGVLLAAYSVTSPHTIHPDANLETLLSFAGGLGLDCSPLASQLTSGAVR